MATAIKLARRGRYTCQPNPQVGCVISKAERQLASGWHIYAGEAHAEINALQSLKESARDATLYVSLEPCSHHGKTPPCIDAIIDAGISRVVIGMADPNPLVSGKGIHALREAGISVEQGLLENDARNLNIGFIKRMQTGRPFICCKLAMSLDGRTALANGSSQWISSEESRRDLHNLRAESAAIVTSAENVIHDDPMLTARNLTFTHMQPVKVILDRELRTPANAKLLSDSVKTVIYTERTDIQSALAADIIQLPPSANWLAQVFEHMATEYEINTCLIEAGSQLSAALLDAGLIDQLLVYLAPKLLGSDAMPLFSFTGLEQLQDAYELRLEDIRQLGNDIRLCYSASY